MKKQSPNLTDQERVIREKGRKFLDELQAKGPKLDNVGKSYVIVSGSGRINHSDNRALLDNQATALKKVDKKVTRVLSPARNVRKRVSQIRNWFSL